MIVLTCAERTRISRREQDRPVSPETCDLNVATVDNQGLIVVSKADPYTGVRNLIVVPSEILPGLLTALHLRFNHPTKSQLTQLFNRHFFAIKSGPAIESVVNGCEQCNSVKKLPRELLEQSCSPSASKPGEMFYADVMRRARQHILVCRDVHSSFTIATALPDETADSLRSGLLLTSCNIRSSTCTIHVDNAPGFQPLQNDATLQKRGMSLDYSRSKNKNSNSVIDKGIQELEQELLKIDPTGNSVTDVQLQLSVEILNSRIRNRGLSAREILFQRDQHTNNQLSIDDCTLAEKQLQLRKHNHPHSAKSKSHGKPQAPLHNHQVGNLVYIKDEGSKNKARDRYIIVKIDNKYAFIQKFGDKFMAKQYQVPLSQLFPASSPPVQERDDDAHSSVDEDSSDDDEFDWCDTSQPNPPAEYVIPQRRSTRQRQAPAWQRSGDYEV